MLKTPIQFSEYIERVCLPLEPANDISYLQGRDVQIVGYGRNKEDDKTETYTLREVELKVYSRTFCNDQHNIINVGKNKEDIINDAFPNPPSSTSVFKNDQFCSGTSNSEEGLCQGDSGAPALYREDPSQPFVQYGVLHGSVGENCNSKDFPSIFLRTDDPTVMNWMTNVMAQSKFIFFIIPMF